MLEVLSIVHEALSRIHKLEQDDVNYVFFSGALMIHAT